MPQAPSPHVADASAQDRPEPAAVGGSSLTAMAYVSSATTALGESDLEALLRSARERNARHGISGVLLYDDGNFFQYFEGPPDGVDLVWGHIRRSSQHTGILPLMRGPIARRAFPDWLMGFTQAPKSFLLQLANASWHERLNDLGSLEQAGDGMSLLLHFWASSRRHEVK